MNKKFFALATVSAGALLFASPAFAAGPPSGVPMGPPAGITMGPPAVALSHIANGVPLGQPATLPQGSAASSGDTIGGTVSDSAKSKSQD